MNNTSLYRIGLKVRLVSRTTVTHQDGVEHIMKIGAVGEGIAKSRSGAKFIDFEIVVSVIYDPASDGTVEEFCVPAKLHPRAWHRRHRVASAKLSRKRLKCLWRTSVAHNLHVECTVSSQL
jgi:hypothetical protein